MGVQRLEHAELRVKDLAKALDFYKEVMGLVEIARDDGRVYLGCGFDRRYDLALVEGGTGVEHFAIRMENETVLDEYTQRLVDHGVKVEQTDRREPGQEKSIRFTLPSGHSMELVCVKEDTYDKPSQPAFLRRHGIAPINIDHINLMAQDIKTVSSFLNQVLDLRFSDITEPKTDFWFASWMRAGEYHHDVAFFYTEKPDENLHHLAWHLASFEHMKSSADILAQSGFRVELGPGRHPVGSNLFLYFWDSGGNRVELSAEGAILSPNTPAGVWKGMEETLDAWGDMIPPDSFLKGS